MDVRPEGICFGWIRTPLKAADERQECKTANKQMVANLMELKYKTCGLFHAVFVYSVFPFVVSSSSVLIYDLEKNSNTKNSEWYGTVCQRRSPQCP